MVLGNIYSNLNPDRQEIRLLRLSPGTWDQSIECDLQLACLDDEPVYEGLSYAWGDKNNVKTIQLNGKPFKVTRNLWMALRRLRKQRHERILWADATCINQDDHVERSNQVAIMGKIFSTATQIFVWLGDSISEHSESFEPPQGTIEDGKDLQWICKNIQQIVDNLSSGTPESETLLAFGMLYLLSIDTHWNEKPMFIADEDGRFQIDQMHWKAWQALLQLLKLSWWERVWVVQELVLAKTATMVVGCVSVPWRLISGFCDSYLKHLPPGACCHASTTWKMSSRLWDDIVLMRVTFWSFYTAKKELHQLQSKPPAAAFWELIWLLRHKQATDPRDKVYGLLGLLHEPFLLPDYSLSTSRTFSMCIEALITSDGDLNALIGPRLREPGFPTFAIDFLPKENSGTVLFFQNLVRRIQSSVLFGASRMHEMRFSLQASNLHLRGVLIDRLREVSSCWPWDGNFMAQTFRDWELLSGITPEHQGAMYPNGSTRSDAFWRTIIRDTVREHQDGEQIRRAKHSDEATYNHFRAWLKNGLNLDGQDAVTNANFSDYRKSFFIATQDQCLYRTDKGYIGLSDNPLPDDEIWILSGGRVPFILRPYPDIAGQPRSYAMVGDCYVHGIMDGEASEYLDGDEATDICLI